MKGLRQVECERALTGARRPCHNHQWSHIRSYTGGVQVLTRQADDFHARQCPISTLNR
jgi:hypothetical protein